MSRRQEYWLYNGTERKDLNGVGSRMLSSVKGLGTTMDGKFGSVADGFFARTGAKTEKQGRIVGTLSFYGEDPYADYQAFVQWIDRAEALWFAYRPGGGTGTLWYRRVTLAYLTKTGELPHRELDVTAAFDVLTPWYKERPTEIEPVDPSAGGWIMDEDIVDVDTLGSSEKADAEAVVKAEGSLPSSFTLTVPGPILNPVITLKGTVTEHEYGRCDLAIEVESGQDLELCTDPQDAYVCVISGGKYTSVLDSADLTHEIYPQIPVTEPCTLALSAEGRFSGTVTVKVRSYERSV